MRTNIEEEAWNKFNKIGVRIGERPTLVAGVAASIWHESQTEMKLTCSIEEFVAWGGFRFDEDVTKWIESFIFFGFLRRTDQSDVFEITGNKRHIDVVETKKRAGALGGRSRNKPQIEINDEPQAYAIEDESICQANAMQYNAIQFKENKDSAVSAKRARKRQEPVEFKNCDALKTALASDVELLESWRKLYPDEEFRKRELIKAWEYYRINERKRPTVMSGWKRVIASWFEKGWSGHAAKIPGQNVNRWGKPEPKPIRYPSADKVFEEQESNSGPRSGPDPETKKRLEQLMKGIVKPISEGGASDSS